MRQEKSAVTYRSPQKTWRDGVTTSVMRVKLSKIDLPEDATIEALNHDDLVALAKLWRVKISEYQDILFRVRRLFLSSSEIPRKLAQRLGFLGIMH